MGQPAYDVLAARCEAHLRSRSALALHPASHPALIATVCGFDRGHPRCSTRIRAG